MSWSRKQIIKLQIYRRHAQLPDADYRDILHEQAGCTSSTDDTLTDAQFDRVMAAVEARLEYRMREGFVPEPPKRDVGNIRYWRRRLPRAGAPNSRLWHRLWDLWDALQPHLPASQRSKTYLAGIASQACGYPVRDVWQLKAWQASLTIEALKDRLAHALANSATP